MSLWFVKSSKIKVPKGINKREWLKQTGYYYNYVDAFQLVENSGYHPIQFTRNPGSRAVSAYLNKFVIYKNQPITAYTDLERFARVFISSFNKNRGTEAEIYNGLSFVDYLLHVKYCMKESNVINHHWDAQLPRDVDFRIKPQFVVHVESLEDDIRKVNQAFDLKDYIPRKHNATVIPGGFNRGDGDLSQVNSLDLIDRKIIPAQKSLLVGDALDLVHEIYEEDYKFFSYN